MRKQNINFTYDLEQKVQIIQKLKLPARQKKQKLKFW